MEVVRANWNEWDELVDRFGERTVFHRSAWLRSLEDAYSLRPLLLKVVEGGECIAVWPWLWFRKALLRIIGSPLPGWSTPYMGPLFADAANTQDVSRAVMKSRELGAWIYAAFRVLDHGEPVDVPGDGFKSYRRFETCYVDLRREEDELWKALKSTCRTRIRKARKSGISVRIEEDDGYLPEFWQMASEVFARSGLRPTFTRRLLEGVHERLFPVGELLVMSAWLDDKRVATLVLPRDDRTAMYWAGGASGDALALAPNNLLHWEAILESRRLGLARYDFISTRGGPGRFKKTFGPTVEELCTHWEASRPRLLMSAKDWYAKRARKSRKL